MLKSLKALSDWDPCYAEEVEEKAFEEIYSEAGVTKKEWEAAVNRVCYDGYYGPISAEDWLEEKDSPERRKVAHLKDALEIVRRGMGASFGDVEFYNPEVDAERDDEGNDLPNCVIEGDQIKKEIFDFHRRIYGCY